LTRKYCAIIGVGAFTFGGFVVEETAAMML